MRQLLWIVCGALVTVLGVSWFASRDPVPARARPSVRAAGPDGSARTERGPGGASRGPLDPAPRSVAGSDAAVVADLAARLDAARDARVAGRHLRRLVRIGSPEAIAVAVGFVERPEGAYYAEAERCAALFAPVRDEQVFLFAERALGRNLAAGRDSTEDTAGFVRLIARNGGRLGAERLLSLLRGTHDGLARSAADAVAIVTDRSLGLDYLCELSRDESFPAREAIADSLVSWRDERLRAELLRLVTDESIPLDARSATVGALAAYLTEAQVAGFVQACRAAAPELRIEFARALARAGTRSGLPADAWDGALVPLALELVGDAEPGLRRAALDAVAERPELRTEVILDALRERATRLEEDGGGGEGELETIRRLVDRSGEGD